MSSAMAESVQCKEEGNACMSAADYVNAMKWYSQAIALSPKDGALYSNRSFAFLRLKLASRALSDAEQAMRLKPGWPKAHFRRAEALSQAGLHADALEDYARGSALDPEDEHLRAQCEAARMRAAAATRREYMQAVVGGAIGIFLVLLILASSDDAGATTAKGKTSGPGIFSSVASIVVGLLLGLLGGGATVLLLRHQRKGSVLPPLQTNDQFAAEQMRGDRDGAGELRVPKGRAAEPPPPNLPSCGASAPTFGGPQAPQPPAASNKSKDGPKARVRSTGNGRAAAMKALGKQK